MNTPTLTRRTLCAAGALLLLAACTPPTDLVHLQGTASYRERMVLPPGARLEITIRDVSLADEPQKVLARSSTELSGAPPYPFTVDYRAADLEAGHTYGVRARIEHDGELLFTTDTFHALPPASDTTPLDLMLVRVQAPSSAALVQKSASRT